MSLADNMKRSYRDMILFWEKQILDIKVKLPELLLAGEGDEHTKLEGRLKKTEEAHMLTVDLYNEIKNLPSDYPFLRHLVKIENKQPLLLPFIPKTEAVNHVH